MRNTSSSAVAYSYVPGFISGNNQLTHLEKLTYLIIDSASGVKRFCWHSQKAIAEMVGCSLSTVIRAIRRLKELGLFRTGETVHGHTLRYYPLVPISRLQSSSCSVGQGGQSFKDRSLCQKDIQILKNNIKKKSLPLPPLRKLPSPRVLSPESSLLCLFRQYQKWWGIISPTLRLSGTIIPDMRQRGWRLSAGRV